MCPKFKVLFNAEVEEFNKNSTKNKDLLDYVSDNAGQKFTNLSDMYFVYDTLLMQVTVYIVDTNFSNILPNHFISPFRA